MIIAIYILISKVRANYFTFLLGLNIMCLLNLIHLVNWYIHSPLMSFFFFNLLEANHFTTLQWVLSYIDMNQPWSYMYSPSLIPPPMSLDVLRGFPGSSDGKMSACNAGDLGSIPGSGRSPGEGGGNPLQYSCLENSMDTGAK